MVVMRLGMGNGLNPLEGTQISLFFHVVTNSLLSVYFVLGTRAWVGVRGEMSLPSWDFLDSSASVSLSCASTRSYVTVHCGLQDKIILHVKRIAFLVITLFLQSVYSVK